MKNDKREGTFEWYFPPSDTIQGHWCKMDYINGESTSEYYDKVYDDGFHRATYDDGTIVEANNEI